MSIALSIRLPEPSLTALAGRVRDRKGLLQVVGRSARNLTVDHFRVYNATHPNALGGRRTNFYAAAASATNYRLVGSDGVVISIPHQGLALRLLGTGGLPGGVLKPSRSKYLTLPASPEAHGKRAGEFSDLSFGFAFDPQLGRMRPALVRKADSLLSLYRGRRAQRPAVQGPGTAESSGEPIFWLVRQVRQSGDRAVLPSDQSYGEAMQAAGAEWFELQLSRGRTA